MPPFAPLSGQGEASIRQFSAQPSSQKIMNQTPKKFTLRLRYDDDLFIVVVAKGKVKNYQWYYGHECFGRYTDISNLPVHVQSKIKNKLLEYGIAIYETSSK